ncbi:MAG: NUDIX hydrolase [Clostridia bacterium]
MMKKLNVIIVYDLTGEKILMCERKKDPYKGKLNLVGGKLEANETDTEAAYRELEEETGITKQEISLKQVMNFQYILSDIELQVFAGKLRIEKQVQEELNPLIWINKNENFFDLDKFAGEGNIGHMLQQVELYKEEIF